METVAVVGVGLIGASFGLALRRAGFTGRILGVSSPPAVAAGLAAGAISEAATLEEVARIADLIYLAQTIDRILEIIPRLGPSLRHQCLVTDAGSTKTVIVEKANKHLPKGVFLGGHPMAGKEQRGAEAADGALFQDRPYVLTPTEDVESRVPELRPLLEQMGARVMMMSPAEHDKTVAATSHVPQLLSTALSATLSAQDNPRLLEVFGPGLLEMTRLSLSSAEVWTSILHTNKKNVTAMLKQITSTLQRMGEELEDTDRLNEVFATGQTFANKLRSL